MMKYFILQFIFIFSVHAIQVSEFSDKDNMLIDFNDDEKVDVVTSQKGGKLTIFYLDNNEKKKMEVIMVLRWGHSRDLMLMTLHFLRILCNGMFFFFCPSFICLFLLNDKREDLLNDLSPPFDNMFDKNNELSKEDLKVSSDSLDKIKIDESKLHDAMYDIEQNYKVFQKMIWELDV